MASVTQRIKAIQQPRGGFLPLKSFNKKSIVDGLILSESENIHASIIGIAVDYLTRFMIGESIEHAFHISFLGAKIMNMHDKATELAKNITGLDDLSIFSACKLAGFDVCYRASPFGYKPIETIEPDSATIENIRIMVTRSIKFWEKYGPVLICEPTFEGGYSATVDAGDGDYVTKDTFWDFKVSQNPPTSKNTLQILMYYVMGLHSEHKHLKKITKLGFFNPRLNTIYICDTSTISPEIISIVEDDIICYNSKKDMSFQPFSSKNILSKTPTASISYTVTETNLITRQTKKTVYKHTHSNEQASIKNSDHIIEFNEERHQITKLTDKNSKKKPKIFDIILVIIFILCLLFTLTMLVKPQLFLILLNLFE